MEAIGVFKSTCASDCRAKLLKEQAQREEIPEDVLDEDDDLFEDEA